MKKSFRLQVAGFSLARFILLLVVMLSGAEASFSQNQPSPIKKSTHIESIDGKKYYIHAVEKGQTLYSIAKTYSTTVDIVLSNNKDAIDGLKTGDKLKIPYSGNTDSIKKEIEKQSTSKAPVPAAITPATPPRQNDTIAKQGLKKQQQPADLKNTVPIPVAAPAPKKDTVIALVENVKPIGEIHVAVFLPLDLSVIDAIDVGKVAQGDEKLPEETKIGIEYYEGIKLAFDSLRKQGFNGFLHVYDSNLDSAGYVKLMQNPELKEMDLIIGPLYGKKFESILKFAKDNQINLVSPTLIGNNMLLGNPNVSKVTPSYFTQTEELAKYVANKYAGQNIIAFNSANPKDKPYLNTFKRIANPILIKTAGADTVKEITFTSLKTFFSKTKPNIVVIPSTNQSFVTEAVNKLYLHKQESKDSIIVVGLSNFQDIESLDFGYLKTLNAVISSYQFVNYQDSGTKKFILNYRHEFKTDPSEYVFAGFDIGYFYLGGLQKYGNDLQTKLPELKQKGIQREFNFFQSDINSGYENRGVGIMKFENYQYQRVQ